MPAAEPAAYTESIKSPAGRFKAEGCVAASRLAREKGVQCPKWINRGCSGQIGAGNPTQADRSRYRLIWIMSVFRWIGRGGGNVGLGIGLGGGALIVGGAIAASAAEQQRRDAIGYCMQRYRSYDPQSMTYLGSDGCRRQCP